MKKIILLFVFVCSSVLSINALAGTPQNTPKVGDELTIASPENSQFRYVKFPKLNFLVKKGNIASYKNIYQTAVVVTEVKMLDNDAVKVTLARKDGKTFFKGTSTVTAYYNQALAAGELTK